MCGLPFNALNSFFWLAEHANFNVNQFHPPFLLRLVPFVFQLGERSLPQRQEDIFLCYLLHACFAFY